MMKFIGISLLFFLYTSVLFAFAPGAPVILRMSDAVIPGKTFSVNGFGFDDNGALEIAMELNLNGRLPHQPSVRAIRPEIIQRDRNGNFIVVIMPATAVPGVYNIWVKNKKGWSLSKRMNVARPLFISEREVFRGLSIKVSGRNLDAGEFSVSPNKAKTKVRLNDDAKGIYEPLVTAVNPYCIVFKIGNEPKGKYFVEVSSDNGINWSRLTNGQQLTVLDEPGESSSYDPLGLGVSWVSHFNWKRIHRGSGFGWEWGCYRNGTGCRLCRCRRTPEVVLFIFRMVFIKLPG